jgi:hypothetical protein
MMFGSAAALWVHACHALQVECHPHLHTRVVAGIFDGLLTALATEEVDNA